MGLVYMQIHRPNLMSRSSGSAMPALIAVGCQGREAESYKVKASDNLS